MMNILLSEYIIENEYVKKMSVLNLNNDDQTWAK